MKISEIFKLGINEGKFGDNRSNEEIDLVMAEKKKTFEEMEPEEKTYYDMEELENPYLDSRVYFDSGKEAKNIFVGIDTEVQEIILADKLGADMVMGHHPEGIGLLKLWKVMDIHREALIKSGVSVNVAERLVEERQEELERGFHGTNFDRAVDAAKLLGMSFINLHTPADNLGNKYMEEFIEKKKPEYLEDLLKSFMEIPEYKIAAKLGVKPKITSGSEKNRTGKVFVKFNGGTAGNKKIFKYLENAGISTFICMHLPEPQLEEAKKYNINVIVMPHMASDSLGLNLLIERIKAKSREELNFIAGSGFIRVWENER